jgi:hypothetical protein
MDRLYNVGKGIWQDKNGKQYRLMSDWIGEVEGTVVVQRVMSFLPLRPDGGVYTEGTETATVLTGDPKL